MHARPSFVAEIESTKAIQPRQGTFDDPARASQAAAVGAAAFGQLTADPSPFEFVPMALRVIGPISLDDARLPPDGCHSAAQARNAGLQESLEQELEELRRWLLDNPDAIRSRQLEGP